MRRRRGRRKRRPARRLRSTVAAGLYSEFGSKTVARREETMRGLMSERPLLISALIEHAARYHGDVEIVSHLVDRSIHRYTYAEAERRSRRLARALQRLGIAPGDRVGTL